MKYIGAFLFLAGVISLILNIIILTKVDKVCNKNSTVKNTNLGNGIISILIIIIGGGMILYHTDTNLRFAFG